MRNTWPSRAVACLGTVLLAMPAAAATFTLKDALAMAYETNPQLAAQQAALRATDEQVAQANAGWRPTINGQGSYGYQNFGFKPQTNFLGSTFSSLSQHPLQAQVTVTQPIFRGGRIYAEVARAKALVRAGRAQLVATEQTVLLNAVTAYMDVVRDTAIVGLRQNNVTVLGKQRDATVAQFKAGALTRTDVAQSEARLASADSDLTIAKGQLATSRANYLQTIGRPSETLQNDPGLPPLPGTVYAVGDLAVKQNPAVVAARENERAADLAVDDAYGALAPQISVQGQYTYSQGNRTQSFGGGTIGNGITDHGVAVLGLLNVPIYQGGAEQAAIRQARELLEQAKQNLEVANRQVDDAVASAWAQFESAQSTIKSSQATEKADEIAYQGVFREQQIGGRTILDVLNAQQELLNAQVAVVSAQHNTVVAAYTVLGTAGSLTAKALELRVKYYDPQDHYDDDESRWLGFGD